MYCLYRYMPEFVLKCCGPPTDEVLVHVAVVEGNVGKVGEELKESG